MQRTLITLGMAFSLLSLPALALAASKEKATTPASGAQYVYLQPNFTVNFGSMGKLKYLRTEIAVKVASAAASTKIKDNLPYLRSDIILLLSSLDSELVNTPQGREQMRKQTLDAVRNRMQELAQEPCAEELYFSNFVVQN